MVNPPYGFNKAHWDQDAKAWGLDQFMQCIDTALKLASKCTRFTMVMHCRMSQQHAVVQAFHQKGACKICPIIVHYTAGNSYYVPGFLGERVGYLMVAFFDKRYLHAAINSEDHGKPEAANLELTAFKFVAEDFFHEDDEGKHPMAASNVISFAPCQRKYKTSTDATLASATKVVNPCQDSLKLARFIVTTFSAPEDLVVDMCSGSGTYSIAAALERRQALAFDTDKDQQFGFESRLLHIQSMVEDEQSKWAKAKAPADDSEWVWNPLVHKYLEKMT